jgi:hypothetical protein
MECTCLTTPWLASYGTREALKVARDLDSKVKDLLTAAAHCRPACVCVFTTVIASSNQNFWMRPGPWGGEPSPLFRRGEATAGEK